jgi:hypothetical protein
MRSSVLVWALAALALPGVCRAQDTRTPVWAGDLSVLAGNALFGGVTAGVLQKARGGSFRDGFERGMVGGAGVYAGKRIAAARWPGAGLVGREVSAVGASVVRNAGAGRPSLHEVMLPVGPLNLYVHPGSGRGAHLKVNVLGVVAAVTAAAEPELVLDAGKSLSAGALVFRAPNHYPRSSETVAYGFAQPATIIVSDGAARTPGGLPHTLSHERVHVLQGDQVFLHVDAPLEAWVLPRIPGGATVHRYLDFGMVNFYKTALNPVFGSHGKRPWEMEANHLDGR